MTISEYEKIYENFKNDNLGNFIDVDRKYGAQCWDLAQYYFIKYLNIPPYVLGGCNIISNMLIPDKIYDLLNYFDEVDIHNMIKGDICIWENGYVAPYGGHIAIFDSCPDGYTCYFLSQNPNPVEVIPISQNGSHAFRLKGITPDPEPTPEPEPQPEPINPDYLLDLVRRTIRGDYGNGQERIDALGDLYDEVQYQVDQNMAFGLTNWDDIRLF